MRDNQPVVFPWLDHILKFFTGDLAIPENLCEQATAYALAPMDGNHRAAAITVLQKVVAAFDADDGKSKAP